MLAERIGLIHQAHNDACRVDPVVDREVSTHAFEVSEVTLRFGTLKTLRGDEYENVMAVPVVDVLTHETLSNLGSKRLVDTWANLCPQAVDHRSRVRAEPSFADPVIHPMLCSLEAASDESPIHPRN